VFEAIRQTRAIQCGLLEGREAAARHEGRPKRQYFEHNLTPVPACEDGVCEIDMDLGCLDPRKDMWLSKMVTMHAYASALKQGTAKVMIAGNKPNRRRPPARGGWWNGGLSS